MKRDELMKLLPHRDGMLLLDSAELIDGAAHGKKLITGEEWFLKGHFPGDPVVPGVILIEIMAQSACVLLAGEPDGVRSTLLTGVERARFRAVVRPGATVETECRLTRSKKPFYFAKGRVSVGGRVCAEAEFSFAVYGESK